MVPTDQQLMAGQQHEMTHVQQVMSSRQHAPAIPILHQSIDICATAFDKRWPLNWWNHV